MLTTPPERLPAPGKITIVAGTLLSALCWYFGHGLTGDYWYLAWVAPMPVLLLSFSTTERVGFWLAFTAYLLGRLSVLPWLAAVMPIAPAVLIVLALSFVFAGIVRRTRNVMLGAGTWYVLFAYPVFCTAFEYLLLVFSPDGTATSLAYSQANVGPLIQVASLTGLLGITFLVSLVPSAVAVGWFMGQRRKAGALYVLAVTALLLGGTWRYGTLRKLVRAG